MTGYTGLLCNLFLCMERRDMSMHKLYSIGEVSKIMGVSVQTLRYWANIKLLEPRYISPTTGYRYYSYDQFHFIDRIKYLQGFSFSLDEIRDILLRNDIEKLINMLNDKKNDLENEIRKLNNVVNMVTWYRDYFMHGQVFEADHFKYFEKRYLVAIKIKKNESKEEYHIRLQKIKNSGRLKNLTYKRQFSLILQYQKFIQDNNDAPPMYIGMFLQEKPAEYSEYVMEIPEGTYFCSMGKILSERCNFDKIKSFFSLIGYNPKFVLANEYENNLYEYTECPYEIQILLPEKIQDSIKNNVFNSK